MPLFPRLDIRKLTFNSKFRGVPPRQMINVFSFRSVSGVISPTRHSFSTLQYLGSPSQSFKVLPSKISLKPESSFSAGVGSTCCPLALTVDKNVPPRKISEYL